MWAWVSSVPTRPACTHPLIEVVFIENEQRQISNRSSEFDGSLQDRPLYTIEMQPVGRHGSCIRVTVGQNSKLQRQAMDMRTLVSPTIQGSLGRFNRVTIRNQLQKFDRTNGLLY